MRRFAPWLAGLVVLAAPSWGMSGWHKGEHPEHPEKTAETGKEATVITSDAALDAVAAFIRDYVEHTPPMGRVTIEDPETGETLNLALDKVHRERLAMVKPDKYFVCADFKADDGTVYDLDFFVRRTGEGEGQFELIEDKTSLHKKAGEARYTWYYDEDKGVWKKKGAGMKKAHEHPESGEHPEKKKSGEGEAEHPQESEESASGGSEHPGGGSEHPEHPH